MSLSHQYKSQAGVEIYVNTVAIMVEDPALQQLEMRIEMLRSAHVSGRKAVTTEWSDDRWDLWGPIQQPGLGMC